MKHKKPDVLVLNKSFIPIHIITWQKAMSLIYTESARPLDRDFVVYDYSDWLSFSNRQHDYPQVATTNDDIAVPEIIVLRRYNKLPQREVKYSRQTIFQRDDSKCAYCNKKFDKKELTIDHIMPKSKGGKSTWMNTITSCRKCNFKKGDKLLENTNMHMYFKPKKPKWISPFTNVGKNHPCKSWKVFLERPLTKI
jgi:5-methylcytosine-specific restriction endonuclease McrA